MKQYLNLLIAFLLTAHAPLLLNAQNQPQLNNGSFEIWANDNGVQNPEGWKSLNPLSLLGAPLTTTPSTDAQNGSTAVKLETKQYILVGTIAGLLYLGTFDAQQGFDAVKLGVPFEGGRPERLSGFLKYTSVNNDSAIIYTQLSKFVSNAHDTIAEASFVQYASTDQYQAFDANFTYNSNETPDSIIIVISSSGSGQNGGGQNGSILWIDNLQLVYGSSSVQTLNPSNNLVQAFPIPADQVLHLKIPENYIQNTHLQIDIYNTQTQKVHTQTILPHEAIAVGHLPEGTYLYTLSNAANQQILSRSKFCLQR